MFENSFCSLNVSFCVVSAPKQSTWLAAFPGLRANFPKSGTYILQNTIFKYIVGRSPPLCETHGLGEDIHSGIS